MKPLTSGQLIVLGCLYFEKTLNSKSCYDFRSVNSLIKRGFIVNSRITEEASRIAEKFIKGNGGAL